MSYSCYICKEIIVGGTRSLFAHLRSKHFVCEVRGVTLKCRQGDCVRCYSTFNSLAYHLRVHHASNSVRVDSSHGTSGNNCADDSLASPSGISDGPVVVSSCPSKDATSKAASFVATLLSSTSVTQRNVQSVVDHGSDLVSGIVDDITRDVVHFGASANVDVSELVDQIQNYRKTFEVLDSQHKRLSCFCKNYDMVRSRAVFLGNRYDQSIDPSTGYMRHIVKRDTFQYVPLLQLIALLLSDASVHREVEQGHLSSDDVMRDLCDGSLFKSNPLFAEDPHALQLCLYYDECEVVNPLGSRRGIHKIGFIYAM